MEIKILEEIGLTSNQAAIYLILLEKGPLPAGLLARRSGIKRSLVYVILESLIGKEIVVKDESKKVTRFDVSHPQKLETLVQQKKQEADLAASAFASTFHQLQQTFEIKTGQPGVRFYAGADGLKHVYKKLNADSPKEIFLIRSTEMESNSEMIELAKEQVQEQVRKRIKVHVISPALPALERIVKKDIDRNTERRIIAREVFDTTAQILIWNNCVAITTYREPIMTTLIEHPDISHTMNTLFTFIWKKSVVDTQENLKKYI